MEIGKTLRLYREKANLSQGALSRLSGVAQSAISNAENDQRELTISSLEKLCKALSISLIDFMVASGLPSSDQEATFSPKEYDYLTPHQKQLINSLIKEICIRNESNNFLKNIDTNFSHQNNICTMHVSGESAAGSPLSNEAFPDDLVKLPTKYNDPSRYRIIRARGDSMEPRIHTGDIIVAQIDCEPFDGQMALIRLAGLADDEYTIKRVYHKKEKFVLRSYNEAYPDMVYSPKEIRSCELIVDVFSGGGARL